VGTRVFAHQVRAAVQAGLPYLRTYASGFKGDKENGYYTWPRLGMQGDLGSLQQRRVANGEMYNESVPHTATPTGIRATTVQELMRTPAGRDAWLLSGSDIELTFPLHEGSESRRVLDAYVKAKGITV